MEIVEKLEITDPHTLQKWQTNVAYEICTIFSPKPDEESTTNCCDKNCLPNSCSTCMS